jgi:phosphoribosylanthranilate isomerase
MPLKTIVKVSHISNLSDARYCAGMGVDILGFQVIPGLDNYIAPEVYQDIRGWISGPRITAELYGLSDAAQLKGVLETYAPDYFELTWTEYSAFREFLTLPCIVYYPQSSGGASPEEDGKIRYWLADENSTCKDIENTTSPVLKKISSLRSLEQTISDGCFQGVSLEAPAALRPGVTNYEQLGAILEALEAD